jgi:uncharacterized membrane protein (UPF0127 family)
MRHLRLAALIVPIVLTPALARHELPTETITIDTSKGARTFHVEIAADEDSQARGLMYRREMAPDAGMIFEFPRAQFVTFWMKDTYLPLDMVFVRADGTVDSIAADAAPMSEAKIPSHEPVKAVIEINAGLAKLLDIEPGDRVHAVMFQP